MLPDFDMQQSDQDSIDALMAMLENEKKVNDDLVMIIGLQDKMIDRLRKRMQGHGLSVLEKSIVETSREELALINKCIPREHTTRAKNPDAMKRDHYREQAEIIHHAHERYSEAMASMLASITNGVDLEKYGIDPLTMCFKPGWGPDGQIPIPWWRRFLNFFK